MTRIAISQLTPDQLDRAWMESEGWTLLLVTHQQRPAMPAWLYEAIDAACGAYWVHEMRQEVRDAHVEGVTRPTQRPYRPHLDDALLVRLMVSERISVIEQTVDWCADRKNSPDGFGETPHLAVLDCMLNLRYPLGYDIDASNNSR